MSQPQLQKRIELTVGGPSLATSLKGAVAGAVVGIVLLLAGIGVMVWYYVRSSRRDAHPARVGPALLPITAEALNKINQDVDIEKRAGVDAAGDIDEKPTVLRQRDSDCSTIVATPGSQGSGASTPSSNGSTLVPSPQTSEENIKSPAAAVTKPPKLRLNIVDPPSSSGSANSQHRKTLSWNGIPENETSRLAEKRKSLGLEVEDYRLSQQRFSNATSLGGGEVGGREIV